MTEARPDLPTARRQSRSSLAWVIAAVSSVALLSLVPLAPAAAQQPTKTAKAKAATKAESAGGSSPSTSDGGLRSRVEQLEEQLVDMQVVVGTLESLARQGASASPAAAPRSSSGGGGLSSGDQARLDSMETQIRALTQQVEQLTEQLRQRRSEAAPAPLAPQAPVAPRAAAAAPSFGATSVTNAGGDPIGSLLSSGAPAPAAGAPSFKSAAVEGAPLPVANAANPADAKALYEAAYGYLLQQDYASAENSFEDFLKKFPSDALAGNAQYWLGESFFVRGQYKQAATAFLKGYQTYGKSAKAPDSLLKLAMSLDRLGQKDAACSSYGELSTRFPTAAQHIKARAQSERARLSCS